MQDRYAGDVGDFSKFALARALHREVGGPLGLIWYRFPDEIHTKDGRHVNYFEDDRFSGVDDELLRALEPIAKSPTRAIAALESSGCLPLDTLYFGEELRHGDNGWSRGGWFENAVRAVQGARIVIVDPDNGISSKELSRYSRRSGKYISESEIAILAAAFECVVIYHHFDRSAKHPEQLHRLSSRLQQLVPNRSVRALRYGCYSARAYFLVYSAGCEGAVITAANHLTSGRWAEHFALHSLTSELRQCGKLILVCGLPGAGKTTYAKKLESELHAIRMCPDDWIEAIIASPLDISKRDRLRNPIENLQLTLTKDYLTKGHTVIMENGFGSKEERDIYLTEALDLGAHIELHYVEAQNLEALWDRVQARNAKLPTPLWKMSFEDIRAAWEAFEVPSAEEMAFYDAGVKV